MDYNKEATFLKVLGHPIRLRIVELLLSSDICVKNIWSCLNLPQAKVSQHLGILKDRGVLNAHRKGSLVLYSVADKRVKGILKALKEEN
ncbi:MAG: winged helix-turn-helix transcriptional regulator [Deltaproteobacteria bacterium]|nr:winged helix-turn-helix transcriptional regulator [Deltaproteobacteria bacterium]